MEGWAPGQPHLLATILEATGAHVSSDGTMHTIGLILLVGGPALLLLLQLPALIAEGMFIKRNVCTFHNCFFTQPMKTPREGEFVLKMANSYYAEIHHLILHN